MKKTVTLDDGLLKVAAEYSGIKETSDLVNHVLKDYVAWEAGKRLAALGGTMPDFTLGPSDRIKKRPNSKKVKGLVKSKIKASE